MNELAEVAEAARDALPFMHKGPIGRYGWDRRLSVRAGDKRGTLLYGPYWRLPEGRWRLRLDIAATKRAHDRRACLGVEIVADNRCLLVARDFAPVDCDAGELCLTFAVSAEQSDVRCRAKFEFRLISLGGADLTINGLWLNRAPGAEPTRSRWSILPRLKPTALARTTADGRLQPRLGLAIGPLAGRLGPRLRLPAGAYALSLCGSGASAALALRVRIGATTLLRCDLGGAALEDGCELRFRVPEGLGIESGEEHRLDLSLASRGGRFTLTSIELAPASDGALPAPAVASGSAKLVIVGNCQAEALAQALQRGLALDRLTVKYHFMALSPLYLSEARRDLKHCDFVLMQGIQECENYPLRPDIPARVQIATFPCLRLASLWPFDSYNGPQDHVAIAAEGEDRAFPYLDWRLAALRETEPDPTTRLSAYAELSGSEQGLVRRLATWETRRLAAMDREFDTDMGAYIAANFSTRRLFHTTTHPGPELMRKLRDWTLRRLGRARPLALDSQLDLMNEWQIPVHPQVARTLGATWADARTLYRGPNGSWTWERYVSSYIQRYG